VTSPAKPFPTPKSPTAGRETCCQKDDLFGVGNTFEHGRLGTKESATVEPREPEEKRGSENTPPTGCESLRGLSPK